MLAREGLRVKIEPIPGLTEKGVLEPTYFQCPPLEEFSVDYAHTHTDYDTPRVGQMSRRGGRQLITATFDTLVVDWGTYTVLGETVEIEEFTEQLRLVCFSGTPFLFTAAHQMPPGGYENWRLTVGGPELQMPAVLRTLRVSEKAGEGDARYLNVSFVEYRDPLVAERKLGRAPRRGGKELPVTGKVVPPRGYFTYRYRGGRGKTMTVQGRVPTFGDPIPSGVSLADLARHFYGDPSKARDLGAKNGLRNWGIHTPIVEHSRFRRRGGKLKIPKSREES